MGWWQLRTDFRVGDRCFWGLGCCVHCSYAFGFGDADFERHLLSLGDGEGDIGELDGGLPFSVKIGLRAPSRKLGLAILEIVEFSFLALRSFYKRLCSYGELYFLLIPSKCGYI